MNININIYNRLYYYLYKRVFRSPLLRAAHRSAASSWLFISRDVSSPRPATRPADNTQRRRVLLAARSWCMLSSSSSSSDPVDGHAEE